MARSKSVKQPAKPKPAPKVTATGRSKLKQIGAVAERYPERTAEVLRRWLNERR